MSVVKLVAVTLLAVFALSFAAMASVDCCKSCCCCGDKKMECKSK